MTISARFLLFDPVGYAWPAVRLPQVAFAGRSNVGKSSLLNALTGSSRLARVSKHPGPDTRNRPLRGRGPVRLRGPARVRLRQGLPVRAGGVEDADRRVPRTVPLSAARVRAGGRSARPRRGGAAARGVPFGTVGALPLGGDESGQALRAGEGGRGRTFRRGAVACRGGAALLTSARTKAGSTCSGGTSGPLFPLDSPVWKG